LATRPILSSRDRVDRLQAGPPAVWPASLAPTQTRTFSGQEPFAGPASLPAVPADYQSEQIAQLVKSLVQSKGAHRSEQVNEGIPPSRSSELAPSVHVTIGRIEVRAVQEQQPAPRQRGGSPVMSLDEYLRRRQRRVRE
jgi:hypothetical protein